MQNGKCELPIHVDSTMISCSRGCLQKFYREFVQGLRPPGLSIDLHAGACFAISVETVQKAVWWDQKPLHEALLRANAAFEIAWGDFTVPDFKTKSKDRVWEAVESYFAQYPVQTDPIQPYFSVDGRPTFEYTFAIPLEPISKYPQSALGLRHDEPRFPCHPNGDPFIYTGRFDLLGRRIADNRPVIRDDKTTGRSMSSDWSSSWSLRSQFLGYCWACQQCGIPVNEVVVRGVQILKTDIKHQEAELPFSQFLIDRWHEQLRRDLWRIRLAWDEGYWDFNLGEECVRYGNCVFMDACRSSTPESWLADFEVRHWNPLDKNPARTDPSADQRAIS